MTIRDEILIVSRSEISSTGIANTLSPITCSIMQGRKTINIWLPFNRSIFMY